MFRLAKRADTPISPVQEVFRKLPEIRRKRQLAGLPSLIDLSIGQPHIPAHPEVMQALNEMKMEQLSHGYSSPQGEQETLVAITKLYKQYYPPVEYKTEETMVTLGAGGALSNVFSILVENPDDVILTFEPFFGAYINQINEWNGSFKKISTIEEGFRPTAKKLEAAFTAFPTTKALILNYPNNPSGVSLTRDELCSLASVLIKYTHILIIIDDVYRDFNFKEHFTLLDVAPQLKDRCIVINSGSKGLLGAPAERIGMIAAHKDLIKCMIPRQSNGIASVPCRTQAALRLSVAAHLKNPHNDWLQDAKKEYKTNVEMAYLEFVKQGFTLNMSDGTFYLLINAKHLIGKLNPSTQEIIKTDYDISNYFLQHSGVATVPGSGFGIDPSKGYLRISCAIKRPLLLEAIKRMGDSARLLLENEFKKERSSTTIHLHRLSVLSQQNTVIRYVKNMDPSDKHISIRSSL